MADDSECVQREKREGWRTVVRSLRHLGQQVVMADSVKITGELEFGSEPKRGLVLYAARLDQIAQSAQSAIP
jgi:hypothetical protein